MAKYFGMVYYICGNFQVKVMFGFRHSEVTIWVFFDIIKLEEAILKDWKKAICVQIWWTSDFCTWLTGMVFCF